MEKSRWYKSFLNVPRSKLDEVFGFRDSQAEVLWNAL